MTKQKNETKQEIEYKYQETTGNKRWIAKLNGLDKKWGYDRDFLAYTNRESVYVQVAKGDVIEYVSYSHSGKNRCKRYYLIDDAALEEEDIFATEIGEDKARELLREQE